MHLTNYEIDFCEGPLRQLSLDPRVPGDLRALAAGILAELEAPVADFRQQKLVGLVEKHGELDRADEKHRLKTQTQREAYKAELATLSKNLISIKKLSDEESALFTAIRVALWLSRANASGDDLV